MDAHLEIKRRQYDKVKAAVQFAQAEHIRYNDYFVIFFSFTKAGKAAKEIVYPTRNMLVE